MDEREEKTFNLVLSRIKRLKHYPEVINLLNDFLKEVSKEVDDFEKELFSANVGDMLFDTLEDHGWIDNDESKKEVQDMINKSVKKT